MAVVGAKEGKNQMVPVSGGKTANQQKPVGSVGVDSAAPADSGYDRWGPGASKSLTSQQADAIPLQLVDGKSATPARTKEELIEEMYVRQRGHGLTDSCSTMSLSGADGHRIGPKQLFGPYATKEEMKRTGFYGAVLSAIILLSIFVIGVLVGVPMIRNKLADMDDRLRKLEENPTRGP